MDRSMRQCGGIFLTTVAIAVALRCAWEVWPGTLLGLFAPQNTSVWELSKIGLWPGIAAAVLYHVPLRDKSSLCAYLMVPAALPVALLFVYWFLRMVCGICSGLVDMTLWVCFLAVGDCMALSVRKTAFMRQALPMVTAIVLIWACAYVLFSVRVPDLPIFTESFPYTSAAIAW